MVRIAAEVESWPGAVTVLPAIPVWGLTLTALGLAWLCLWRRRWRLWGGLALAAGVATVALVETPHVLVDDRGKLLAVRTDDGTLALSSMRAAPYSRETWLRRVGQEAAAGPWPRHGVAADGRLRCDPMGCVYRAEGVVVALAQQPGALAEDCRRADVVISSEPVRQPCPAPWVIDLFELWRKGAHALWIDKTGVRIETANGDRGHRPWVVRPTPRYRQAGT